jgi:glutathione synthase/RimK-type ligase-like ATP-grasp enzyme
MMKKSTAARMPDLGTMIGEGTSIDSNYDSASAARELMTDDQIMALAIKIADIFPGLPLLGIDIIKHVETGELFALEVNGGGNTWQFSSRQAAHGRLIIGKEERVKQFDAWNTCARALVETTRSHAS